MKNCEVEAIFHRERFRKGDWFVGEATVVNGSASRLPKEWNRQVVVAGEGELQKGLTYRFDGHFTSYRNENQIKFRSFTLAKPSDAEGIINYLVSIGTGLGVGIGTATKIHKELGEESLSRLREEPRLLLNFSNRITDEQIEQFAAKLAENEAFEKVSVELHNLLKGRGFPKATQKKAMKEWGTAAADVIRNDPYRLMLFKGCGFLRCDEMYLAMGLDPAKLRRQALCAWYAIASDSNGHTWLPYVAAKSAVKKMIGSARAQPDRAIEMALRIGRRFRNHYGALAIKEVGDKRYLATGTNAWNEHRLSKNVAWRIRESEASASTLWPDLSSCEDLSPHQREEIAKATVGRIGILAGSPGTGKTYTITRLLKHLNVPPDQVAIGAPTGKAAVRVTELMSSIGLEHSARTWHSLLGVGESGEDGGWSFRHNASNPWNYRVVIGDEESMKDTHLAASVFSAMSRDCHFLMVGDPYQLLPVGVGAPLRDLIAAGVPCGELREIRRNSGGIVEACAAIRDNEPWECGDNLQIHATSDHKVAALRLCTKESDPVWDAQVLVAVNDRSPASRKAINLFLQHELNQSPKVDGCKFRQGDKVIVTKNTNVTIAGGDEEVRIFNGEIGKVVEIREKAMDVQLTAPERLVRVPSGKGNKDENQAGLFDLAYAISVHKSQGSEFKRAIVILDDYAGARMVCDKAWIYTAISRGKERTDLVGNKTTANAMCRQDRLWKRKTFLRELVLENHVEAMMEGF